VTRHQLERVYTFDVQGDRGELSKEQLDLLLFKAAEDFDAKKMGIQFRLMLNKEGTRYVLNEEQFLAWLDTAPTWSGYRILATRTITVECMTKPREEE
jgi:hypothetical protein